MFDTVLSILNEIVIIVLAGSVIVFMAEMSLKRVIAYNAELKAQMTPKEKIIERDSNPSLSLRLQAFERLTIFLERINIYSIVLRLNSMSENAIGLQYELIQSIRGEFEHNFSQQIYVSTEAWELVKNAKEEIIQIINNVSNTLPSDATSLDLSQALMSVMLEQGETLSTKAIEVIKKEANIYMYAE